MSSWYVAILPKRKGSSLPNYIEGKYGNIKKEGVKISILEQKSNKQVEERCKDETTKFFDTKVKEKK